MSSANLITIENRLDELIHLCVKLERENASLRAKESVWEQERMRLVEKNEIARKRVEAMIQHLKELDTLSSPGN